MIMNTPTPYNLNIEPLLQGVPLAGGRNPFPCNNHHSFVERTQVEAGGTTLVNFTGDGHHGGGSCQFSITYNEPVDGKDWNMSAQFKTIYSIIGGCPGLFTHEAHETHGDGKHCGNDTGINCIRHFMIPIPKLCVIPASQSVAETTR
jgi:hypothetical protein